MIRFDSDGLVPVVIQDVSDGRVLMLAFMNEEALRLTRQTGRVHLWSRSRQRLWLKGEQSGHFQHVSGIYVNCEENSLLLEVEQVGCAACHTGYRSCFYRRLGPDGSLQVEGERVFDPGEVYNLDAGTSKPDE